MLVDHGPDGILPVRERLVRTLERSCRACRGESLQLRDAVREFVRAARHTGLSLEWVLTAIEDAIDAGLEPPLDEYRRRALSTSVRRMVDELTGEWPSLPGTVAKSVSAETPQDIRGGRRPRR